MTHDITVTLGKAATGITGSLIAALSPYQEHAAWTGGFAVMLLSVVSLSLDVRRKWRDRDKPSDRS